MESSRSETNDVRHPVADPLHLVRSIQGMGLRDPVLVVADNATIAAHAPAWAASFDGAGWTHRVRLFTGGRGEVGRRGIVEEARNLRAASIVAAGEEDLVVAAAAAAEALSLPLVRCTAAAGRPPDF